MPKRSGMLPRAATAAVGAALASLLAYPPARKQITRLAGLALDEIALRAETPWTKNLVVLTTEGHESGLPRTSVLSAVRMNGQFYLVPLSRRAGWLANIRKRPDVVVDDRKRVRRAQAELVEGAERGSR